MKMHISKFITTSILTIFLSTFVNSQPSFHVPFYFRLFDKDGKAVDYEKFCSEYKSSLKGLTSCTNKNMSKQYTYNDSTKYFNGSGEVIYNNLGREFIHEKDTMTLFLKTYMKETKTYRIDSLYIKPGKYLIDEYNLKSINFKKAEIDYYNWILKLPYNLKRWHEIYKLKKKYNISLDDYSEKTIDILEK